MMEEETTVKTRSSTQDKTRSEDPDRVSIKSDSSMIEPMKFAEGETKRSEDPDRVSMKSDSSMTEPMKFAEGETKRSEDPDRVSMKSDSSMIEPMKFAEGETKRSEDPDRVSMKGDDSMFDTVEFAAKQTKSDYTIKLVVVGDSAVGKTALLVRFADHEYRQRYFPTIGANRETRTMKLDGKNVELQIWDVGGQEAFRSVTSTFYKGAHGIIIAYDVTDQSSFNNVERWLEDVDSHTGLDVNKLLVANKCDLTATRRAVDYTRAKDFADKLGIPFLETSAKSGANVAQAFKTMATKIKSRMDSPRTMCHILN